MSVPVVVLDANVLYGIEVTDLLLTMATHGMFRPHWSPQILREVTRNLGLRRDIQAQAVDRRIAHMNRALPAAMEDVPPSLVDRMPVNHKDRHVLALAVHVGASVIVTENLRDFPAVMLRPFDTRAISMDDFVLGLVVHDAEAVLASVEAMATRRLRYPKTIEEIIQALQQPLPESMVRLLSLGTSTSESTTSTND